MRSLVGLLSNGGAVANFWQRIPFLIKAPLVTGLVLLAGAELTRDVNQAWVSSQVAKGEAAKGDAQTADPNATRAAVLAGKPVTGAERTIAAQVAGLDADADQKRATADAANESEEELIAKARRGAKLTSTEKLRWRELQLKDKELAIREQELAIKTAEASAAYSTAAVKNVINGMILGDNGGLDAVVQQGKRNAECATDPLGGFGGCVDRNGLDRFGRLARRAMDGNAGISKFTDGQYEKSFQRTFGVPLHPQGQSAGGDLVDRVMSNGALTPSLFKRRDPGETVRRMEGRISDPFQ